LPYKLFWIVKQPFDGEAFLEVEKERLIEEYGGLSLQNDSYNGFLGGKDK